MDDLKAMLDAIGWSGATLACKLECHRTLPQAWLSGRAQVPAAVTAWLVDVARLHARNPPPPNWRTRSSIAPTCTLHVGECLTLLREFAAESIDLCLTSPPFYFVRDYGCPEQIGLEPSQEGYIARLIEVFEQVRRVLKPTGSLWLHIADNRCTRRAIRLDGMRSVAKGVQVRTWKEAAEAGHTITGAQFRPFGIKDGDLFLTPSELAIALRKRGWHLRAEIILKKRSVVPERQSGRPTLSHDYLYLLTKQAAGYIYNHATGVADRTVWDDIAPSSYRSEHTAAMSEALAARCILTGSNPGGRVLDPFAGVGTTGLMARRHGRHCDLIELNPVYARIAQERIDAR